MEKKLKISLGSDNFKKLVTTSDIFVDKSLFIKEVLESGEEAILITRPRRWGKSLALDMLKTFLAIEVDASGNKVAGNSNRVLFKSLKVAESTLTRKNPNSLKYETKNILDFQGQYPVIHLSLKDVKALTYDKASKLLLKAIEISFSEHYYLTSSLKLSTFQKAQLDRYYKAFVEDNPLDEARLKDSIRFLSELLETHYDQKVYILVDEYDKPVNFFLENGLNSNIKERDALANLVESILSKCGKDNKHLQKIILIGIFDSLKKEGNSGFNNVAVYGLTSTAFSHHFGFSAEEVRNLVTTLNFQNQDQIFNNIKEWYNGYFVPVHGKKYIHVYTPWAVMRYLSAVNNDDTATPQNYWVQSGASTMFQTLLQGAECNNSPLANSLLNITTLGNVTLEYDNAMSLFRYDLSTASTDESIFSYLLLNAGYLTALTQNVSHITLSIPNYEVKGELKNVFNKHVKNLKDKKGDICEQIQKAFNQETTTQPAIDLVKSIIFEDEKQIAQYLKEINYGNANYVITPLHLSALTGNSAILKIVHESNKFKQEPFERSYNLTIADYAYMSSNQMLLNFTRNTYNAKISIDLPNRMDSIMCPINYISTTVFGIIVATGISKVSGYLSGLLPNVPQPIKNHPVLSAMGAVTILSPFIYSKIPSYAAICENYYLYTSITLPTPVSKDLNSFIKYRLLHNETSYVKLGTQCNSEDTKISQFNSDITKDVTPEMNQDENHFSISLCSKTLDSAKETESYQWQKAGICVAQIATLGVMGKFLYNLYNLAGPVLTAHGHPAAAGGPLVAANNLAKSHELLKFGIGSIVEIAELYFDPHACPETIGNLYDYITGE